MKELFENWNNFLAVLEEGRYSDAIKNYPQMKAALEYLLDKTDNSRFVDVYALWLAKNIKKEIEEEAETLDLLGSRTGRPVRLTDEDYLPSNPQTGLEVKSVVGILNPLAAAISDFEKIKDKLKNRDPNRYPSIKSFINTVEVASEGLKDKDGYRKYLARAEQAEGDIIYNNPKDLIIMTIADNFEESCDLGYSSWCVSHRPTLGRYYETYKNRGNRIYFVHHFFIPKSKVGSERFSKVAFQKEMNGWLTLWDERDKDTDLETYKEWLISKLGEEKANSILNRMMTNLEQDWQEAAKPKKVVLDKERAVSIERYNKGYVQNKLYSFGLAEDYPLIGLGSMFDGVPKLMPGAEILPEDLIKEDNKYFADLGGEAALSFRVFIDDKSENKDPITEELFKQLKEVLNRETEKLKTKSDLSEMRTELLPFSESMQTQMRGLVGSNSNKKPSVVVRFYFPIFAEVYLNNAAEWDISERLSYGEIYDDIIYDDSKGMGRFGQVYGFFRNLLLNFDNEMHDLILGPAPEDDLRLPQGWLAEHFKRFI